MKHELSSCIRESKDVTTCFSFALRLQHLFPKHHNFSVSAFNLHFLTLLHPPHTKNLTDPFSEWGRTSLFQPRTRGKPSPGCWLWTCESAAPPSRPLPPPRGTWWCWRAGRCRRPWWRSGGDWCPRSRCCARLGSRSQTSRRPRRWRSLRGRSALPGPCGERSRRPTRSPPSHRSPPPSTRDGPADSPYTAPEEGRRDT